MSVDNKILDDSIIRDIVKERNVYKAQLKKVNKFLDVIFENSNPSYIYDKKRKLQKDIKRLQKEITGDRSAKI